MRLSLCLSLLLTLAAACTARPPAPSVPATTTAAPRPTATVDPSLVDPRRLVTDSDAFRDKRVTVQGRVVSVRHIAAETEVRLSAVVPDGSRRSETLGLVVEPENRDILPQDCWRFRGKGIRSGANFLLVADQADRLGTCP